MGSALKGKLSRHKRSKFGCTPGDIGKAGKIEMLEKGFRETPFGDPGYQYKRDFVKTANRRMRHRPIEEDESDE